MKQQNSRDMTEGDPIRLILAFALPLFLGNVFQMFYNMADAAIVGRFLGPQALAAVGAAGPGYNLFTMVISGFAGGASVVVAQAFGSGDEESMRRAYSTSMLLLVLSGAAVTGLGFALTRPLLLILRTPEDVLPGCLTYLRWMCAGVLATCLYNGTASILRAIGNSVTPLAALVVSSLLNIVLDWRFVVPLGMGIAGAAAATLLSQLASGLYCLIYIRLRLPAFRIPAGQWRLHRAELRETVRLGLPAALSTAVVTFSVMLIQRAVNAWGSTVMAAYTASNRAENICMCLSYSMGLATGVFAAQNAGARQYGRVKAGLRAGLKISLVYHAADVVHGPLAHGPVHRGPGGRRHRCGGGAHLRRLRPGAGDPVHLSELPAQRLRRVPHDIDERRGDPLPGAAALCAVLRLRLLRHLVGHPRRVDAEPAHRRGAHRLRPVAEDPGRTQRSLRLPARGPGAPAGQPAPVPVKEEKYIPQKDEK